VAVEVREMHEELKSQKEKFKKTKDKSKQMGLARREFLEEN
jgi:hypothetical protein